VGGAAGTTDNLGTAEIELIVRKVLEGLGIK
jgi:hypothetical protein